jgi:hypothetical protein
MVYNLLGEQIKTLVDEFKKAGQFSVDFEAGNLPAGIYFYKLEVEDFTGFKKMLLQL